MNSKLESDQERPGIKTYDVYLKLVENPINFQTRAGSGTSGDQTGIDVYPKSFEKPTISKLEPDRERPGIKKPLICMQNPLKHQ